MSSPLISDADVRAIAIGLGVREVVATSGDVLRAYDAECLSDESVTDFIKRIKPDREHWFTVQTDDNENEPALYGIDAQGRYAQAHGEHVLRNLLAKNGLKPGQTKAPPKGNAELKPSENPYWKGFNGDRTVEIARLIASGKHKLCASLAKAAGCTLTGEPLHRK